MASGSREASLTTTAMRSPPVAAFSAAGEPEAITRPASMTTI